MSRIFLSYSRADAARVEELHRDLESLGHKAWLDQELSGGQRWWERILESIRECEAFVLAVSGPAIESRACLSEFEYAMALGKPVLPVMVVRNVSDSMMPPALAELQRVDYTQADKSAFAALNRGLASLPPAPPLVEPLPEPPAVPASYLFDLRTELDFAGTLTPEQQVQLFEQLKTRLGQGHDAADLRALVGRFRARRDVLARIDRELGEYDRQLASDTSPQTGASAPEGRPGDADAPGPGTPTGASTTPPGAAGQTAARASAGALGRPGVARRVLLGALGVGALVTVLAILVGVLATAGSGGGAGDEDAGSTVSNGAASEVLAGGADEADLAAIRRAAALSAPDGRADAYPQFVVDDFMAACLFQGGTQPACRCAIDGIQEGLTLDEYLEAYEAAMYGYPVDPHVESVLFDVGVECGGFS